ncbi:triphosphoribosyl-dephospho-CoA synthase CitG [Lactobacillus mulieris]|uniref:triphosphoribosyl-dephospho-CoA synthase CitG n=1 Tax=Lactobacillus mulieris TaxID=2508708 RepID=UPI0001B2AE33|nr:triphosphoribosyl-dephospho-CoA synthase CitG [Lactobacillus mulieris]EEU21461.1 triphosphoribosyl-dephospho-CoA synthase CitG [Lactobacillus jensenii 27-2-CHN]EEX24332.1 triphosphoribosyl-dephospho-CoA synthase CitG [Lactobacillus jensenii 115-3-CHN]KAA9371747.1 triphosphoribosyl-dephospho-CoA synthase CitG [Lactobacillus jensenii]MCW8072356.1 triphosphoribosyl-dephospho-CoA synthase CitG [Lactobacillus mulieris]MDK6267958.1 triphosphoribosyl-dephospho-CoA synthase CitG [Lactobacillus muli
MKYLHADLAIKALLYEVVTLPKPGLVDPATHGSHPDMDIYTFIDSTLSLRTYFEKAEELGRNYDGKLSDMFEKLRKHGIKAEQRMFASTKGINTHKGAIFSLGIFVCACSYAKSNNCDVFKIVQSMTQGLVERDLANIKNPKTAGEIEYQKYGKAGIRGQAEVGYPIVNQISLPFLRQATGTLNEKLLDTLMKIASVTEDSNFIKRAGSIEKLDELKKWSKHFLDLGGAKEAEALAYLSRLDNLFSEKNYSLGGCADLLIITIFLALEEGTI